MARRDPTFVCQNCGAASGRWQGKCDACGEWNTLVEEGAAAAGRRAAAPRKGRLFALEPLAGEAHDAPRLPSGIAEFDRVTGGGFVRGSVLLMAGDPGIGKSTLLIQVGRRAGAAPAIAPSIFPARKRSRRCGCAPSGSALPTPRSSSPRKPRSKTSSPRCRKARRRASIVIDSIQTMWTDTVEVRARHRHAGARRGADADPFRQALAAPR